MKLLILTILTLFALCAASAVHSDLSSIASDALAVREAHPEIDLPNLMRGLSPYKARLIFRLKKTIAKKNSERKNLRAEVFTLQGKYNRVNRIFHTAERRLRGYELCLADRSLFFERCKQRKSFFYANRYRCKNIRTCGSRARIEAILQKRETNRNTVAEELRKAVNSLTDIRVNIQKHEKRLERMLGAERLGANPSVEPRRV